jgi:heme/copper-type cytochrome/quinol oxidase subunit 3
MSWIKLLIISELMLFITCFWYLINFRIIINYTLFIYPLFSSYAFSIPISNLLILVLSSYPLNGSQIAIKNGDLLINIYLLFITILFGVFFILLQLKEFIYSGLSRLKLDLWLAHLLLHYALLLRTRYWKGRIIFHY